MSDRAASPLPSVDFPPAQSTTTSAPAAPMDDEYNPADPAPRDRDRSPSRRERSRSRERERGERRRSPSYEKEERACFALVMGVGRRGRDGGERMGLID